MSLLLLPSSEMVKFSTVTVTPRSSSSMVLFSSQSSLLAVQSPTRHVWLGVPLMPLAIITLDMRFILETCKPQMVVFLTPRVMMTWVNALCVTCTEWRIVVVADMMTSCCLSIVASMDVVEAMAATRLMELKSATWKS
jgi:hypothetical protein